MDVCPEMSGFSEIAGVLDRLRVLEWEIKVIEFPLLSEQIECCSSSLLLIASFEHPNIGHGGLPSIES